MAVRVFEKFLVAKGIVNSEPDLPPVVVNWAELCKTELSKILRRFYAEARTTAGHLYKKSTLLGLRSGLNRHLNSVSRIEREPIDITSDPEFKYANDMFKAMKKVLKKNNKAAISHHPSMNASDHMLLQRYFQSNIRENAKVLQQQVFINIATYFGRRGRENLRQLRISDFAASTFSSGQSFIYLLSRSGQEDEACNKNSRMYESEKDGGLCPVKLFINYTKRLNPECVFMFQKPKKKVTEHDQIWYEKTPLGERSLGDMMSTISTDAGLSKHYTNHSIQTSSSLRTLTSQDDFHGKHQHTSLKNLTICFEATPIRKEISDIPNCELREEFHNANSSSVCSSLPNRQELTRQASNNASGQESLVLVDQWMKERFDSLCSSGGYRTPQDCLCHMMLLEAENQSQQKIKSNFSSQKHCSGMGDNMRQGPSTPLMNNRSVMVITPQTDPHIIQTDSYVITDSNNHSMLSQPNLNDHQNNVTIGPFKIVTPKSEPVADRDINVHAQEQTSREHISFPNLKEIFALSDRGHQVEDIKEEPS